MICNINRQISAIIMLLHDKINHTHASKLGHAKEIFCFSDSADLFLADFLINIPDIMI
jgi:hypothetical protein